MKKWEKTIVSLVLALTLALSAAESALSDPDPHTNAIQVIGDTVKVWDPDQGEYVEISDELAESKELDGNLSVETGHTGNNDALSVCAEGENAAFTVDGSVELNLADTEGDGAETAAVRVEAYKGVAADVTVDGKAVASAEVAGEGYGGDGETEHAVFAMANGDGAKTTVTIGQGAEGQVTAWAVDGGETTVIIQDGGVTATNPTGCFDNEEYEGAAVEILNEEGTVSVSVTGGVTGEGGSAVIGLNEGGSTTILITGDVTASEASQAVAVQAEGEGTETYLAVDGDVSLTGSEELPTAAAVELIVQDEAAVTATFTGEKIEATGMPAENGDGGSEAIGLELVNNGGNLDVVAVTDISAKGAEINTGVQVKSVPTNFLSDPSMDPIEIPETAIEDRIQAKNEYGENVTLYRYQGEWYACNDDGLYIRYSAVYDEGTTNLTITGDITGEQFGMQIMVPDDQDMTALVDGTITGDTAGIVLEEYTEIGDNLKMAVWEVVPNKDKALIVRSTTDDYGKTVYTEDREAEKLLRYIIRIEENSRPYIDAYGTTDFMAGNGDMYQVAGEGDKILMKLNIPSDKELVAAYWDKNQSEAGKLLVDSATGEYYVEVPRGGGVMLSVILKDAEQTEPVPEPVPKPEPAPAPAPASAPKLGSSPEPGQQRKGGRFVNPPMDEVLTELVVLHDLDQRITITFYTNRTFVAVMENGSREPGTFRLENDELLLDCGRTVLPISNDGSFSYISATNPEWSYNFIIDPQDLTALKDAAG